MNEVWKYLNALDNVLFSMSKNVTVTNESIVLYAGVEMWTHC